MQVSLDCELDLLYFERFEKSFDMLGTLAKSFW
jgi:hypothetical protein